MWKEGEERGPGRRVECRRGTIGLEGESSMVVSRRSGELLRRATGACKRGRLGGGGATSSSTRKVDLDRMVMTEVEVMREMAREGG